MINNFIARIAAILGAALTIFTIGNFLGRKTQKIKQLEEDFSDAAESKKRQENRRNDDIADVKRRMQKYVRK